jgi:putative zinc finger/helix-turn-helix YgiT family protein
MRLKNKITSGNQSVCPKCGGDSVKSHSYSDTVDFRNLELDVDGLLQQWCDSCRFGWETPEQSEANHLKIKDAYATARDRLRVRDGLLTGDQIQNIRKKLSLTQKEAALLFGGGVNAFNKYESGEVLQSYAMDRLIRLVGFFGDIAVEKLRSAEFDEIIFPQVQATATKKSNAEFEKKCLTIYYGDFSIGNNADYVPGNMKSLANHQLYELSRMSSYPQDIDNHLDTVLNKPRKVISDYEMYNYSECIQKQTIDPHNSFRNLNSKEFA